jgi:hypothetical protein
MKGRMLSKILFIPAFFLMCVLSIYGQTEKQVVPSDLKQQTLVTEPVTLRKGFFRAGAILNYRVADKYFNDKGSKEYYITSSWGTKSAYNFILQYGFSDRFEVDLLTEYMYSKQKSQSVEIVPGTNTIRTITSKQKGLGFGDTHIEIKYQLIPESGFKVSLTTIIKATLPTGQKNPTNIRSANIYDLPVGDGTYALAGELFARTVLYPYSFTASLLCEYSFKGSKLVNATDPDETAYKPGNLIESVLGVNIHLNEWIVFANQLSLLHEGQGWIGNTVKVPVLESLAVKYVPGLVFQVKKFRIGEAVYVPVSGRNVPADPLYTVTIQYVF